MSRTLRLEVVTPERTLLSADVRSVVAPASDGYLGILPGHAPMVAGLTIGILQFGPEGAGKERVAVSGGFLEVSRDRVVVLADAAERAEEIDVTRARAARERAERRLSERRADIDRVRAELALRRALNRLRTAGVAE